MTYRQCDLDLRCLALFLLSYCKTITVGFEPTLPERQSGVLTATLRNQIFKRSLRGSNPSSFRRDRAASTPTADSGTKIQGTLTTVDFQSIFCKKFAVCALVPIERIELPASSL